ncbi:hypothetical protein B0H34DRAFT_678659 [Crassisporium funariophilum]|nr:hypothetical protein B0H34DRAFT_678659 [Crassisporium funariophilum]
MHMAAVRLLAPPVLRESGSLLNILSPRGAFKCSTTGGDDTTSLPSSGPGGDRLLKSNRLATLENRFPPGGFSRVAPGLLAKDLSVCGRDGDCDSFRLQDWNWGEVFFFGELKRPMTANLLDHPGLNKLFRGEEVRLKGEKVGEGVGSSRIAYNDRFANLASLRKFRGSFVPRVAVGDGGDEGSL